MRPGPEKSLLQLAIIRAAAALVPRLLRRQWLTEWQSELWYIRERDHHDGTSRAVAFCLGAFADGMWMRRNAPPASGTDRPALAGSMSCVCVLAVIGAGTMALALCLPASFERKPPAAAHALVLLMALLVLPSTVSLGIGRYPSTSAAPRATALLRWWIFLGAKFVLAAIITFFGIPGFAALTNTPVQAHGWIVGYVVGFRWAVLDQRKRCPVCLRKLTLPARIGSNAHIFLEWHGTELVCSKGHGLLQVPEVPLSYSTDRWLHLDSSWGALFTSQSETRR